jgi:hypothetical protein
MPRKQTTRHVDQRIGHKQERAAVRQVLAGGHVRQPQLMHWSSSVDPIPVIDDVMPHRSGHKDGCPKNHGGEHKFIPNPKRHFHKSTDASYGWWVGDYEVCQYCNKRGQYPATAWGSWLVRDPALLS